MDNFRRRSRDNPPRQALDSFLRGPSRSRPLQPPAPAHRPGMLRGRVRPTGRPLDDFRRPVSSHAAQRPLATPSPAAPVNPNAQRPSVSAAQSASILHMTLPGGSLEAASKRRPKAKKRLNWRTFRKWSLRSALALTAIVLIVGGVLFAKGLFKLNKVFKGGGSAPVLNAQVKPELLKGEGDGRVNILLMGRGGPGHDGADLTDTIIVASVDPTNKTTTLVSIPRDLWVSVSGHGSTKINAVYANAKYRARSGNPNDAKQAETAGADAVKQIVSQVLGIPIHYYGMVDFAGFKQAVDVVGGVDINVPDDLAVSEHLWDSTTGRPYYLNVPAGQQHFDATRALYFARSRHTSKRGDFDRAERQRLFIQALSQKVLSAGTYTNPLKISELMSAFGDHVSTDMSLNNALRLVDITKGMDMNAMKSIGLADPPNNFVRTDNINGLSVVRPTAGVGDYSQIQSYIRNTLKDPFLAKEAAVLSVLNGTSSPGLAGKRADELKSYGYNVLTVADAPTSDYPTTTLIDLTNGKKPYTKNYLEKRLNLKATTRLPDTNIQTQGIDFVVILGQDEL